MQWTDYVVKYTSPWIESDTDTVFNNVCVVIFILAIMLLVSVFIILKNNLKDGLKHYWENSEPLRRPPTAADKKKALALLYISMPTASAMGALLLMWYCGIPIIWIFLKCYFDSVKNDDEVMRFSAKEKLLVYFFNPVLPYLVLAFLMLFGMPYKLIP